MDQIKFVKFPFHLQDIFTDMRVTLGGKSSQRPEDPIETTNTILTAPSTVKQNITVFSPEKDGRNSGK